MSIQTEEVGRMKRVAGVEVHALRGHHSPITALCSPPRKLSKLRTFGIVWKFRLTGTTCQ